MPLNLLVVEDDSILRSTIVEFAARHCFNVHEESSGEAALRYIDSHAVDVLITDWDLGAGIDGIQVAQHTVAHHPSANAILITAKSVDELRERCDFLSSVTVLHKPFSLRTLRTTLGEIQELAGK
jgi:two-component system response regulator FlrC